MVVVSLAVGDECRRCRVPALPRPVVGVSPAAGDKPQPYIRSAALPPAVHQDGGCCFGRLGMGAGGAGLPPAVGDECRRCRVPALPRPVVGVPPAAGDKPQPYIRTAALPPAVQGAAVAVGGGDECRRYWGGVAAGGTFARRLLYGRTVELLHVAE